MHRRFRRVHCEAPTGSPWITTRNSPDVTKQKSIPYRKAPYQRGDREALQWALRIPLSPTYADIKSYLEMMLDGDTDPNAMDDELRDDIMRILPEKISER